jgi:glycosyltransferase involved in cell wall biosynthesis
LVREWLGLLDEPFDVVHAHSSVAGAMTRAFPHRIAPVVYSPHALASDHRLRTVRLASTSTERRLSRRTAAFAAVSEAEREKLVGLTHGRQPVVVVPHFVRASDDPLPRFPRKPRIVAVGRLCYQKNPESVAELPGAMGYGDAVDFVWVGDGDPRRKRLLQTGGWQVTGWLPRAQVKGLLADSMVLVHPARYEGMPFVVLEAMAQGTPVVQSSSLGLGELSAAEHFIDGPDLRRRLDRLLSDELAWSTSSAAVWKHVKQSYDRESQFAALSRLYAVALGSSCAPVSRTVA